MKNKNNNTSTAKNVQTLASEISYKIPLLICALCFVAFGIKNFSEPDLWWQMLTGKYIVTHFQVPHQDMFSYLHPNKSWINVKWGFEVVAYLISINTGPECVYLLQCMVNLILFFLLIRFSKIMLKEIAIPKSQFFPSVIIALFVLLLCCEYRMNGRPEMFSHLLCVVFVVILFQYVKTESKMVFALIPLQLIWTNFHEAYGTGIILVSIFCSGIFIDTFFLKTESKESGKRKIKTLLLVLLLCIITTTINPYGFKLLLQPLNIFMQVQSNKFTTELANCFKKTYWQYNTWISLLLVAALCFYVIGKWRKSDSAFLKRYGSSYFLLCGAFLFLSLTAYRNIIFLMLILFPLAVEFTSTFFSGKQYQFRKRTIRTWLIIIGIVFYSSIVSNKYYNLTNSHHQFGLEVTSINNPTGAADFILSHHLNNQKSFSDYLSSSYLLWKLYPAYKSWTDLRDLDVFSEDEMNSLFAIGNNPKLFHQLDLLEHFKYVVLYRNINPKLHSYLYNDSLYALTYCDAVASVYEKTDSFTRADIFSKSKPVVQSTAASLINHVFNPFYFPLNYDEVNYNIPAAEYYTTVFQIKLAQARIDDLLRQHLDEATISRLQQNLNSNNEFMKKYAK